MISTKSLKMVKLSFSCADTKQLDHYILPPLVDDKCDAVIIHCRHQQYPK